MRKVGLCLPQMVLGGWDELPQLKKTPLKATILQITGVCVGVGLSLFAAHPSLIFFPPAEDYSQLVGKGGSTLKKV